MDPGSDVAVEADAVRERLRVALAGRYAVTEVIGYGASAVVFAARDLAHFDREVALKVMRPDVAASLGTRRFNREMQLVAQLTHPHIVPLLDWGDVDGMVYYVMPRLEGESLRARLRREQQLALDDAVRITRAVASALQSAHAHGVIHRDIKPENILLSEDVASLADFGLAREVDDSGSRATAPAIAVGTAAYMSPEAAGGGPIDARADQYSLACVLFEMLAGDPPFHASTVQGMASRHRHDPPPRLTTVRPSVPLGIEEAVLRALAKVPADRFSTVAVFAQAVEASLTGATLAAERAVIQREAKVVAAAARTTKRTWVVLGAAAAVAVGLWAVALGGILPGRGRLTLDVNRLAVAPFDVFDEADTLWRDGLVDVFSRNLDDAGPLRTVPASTVIKGWAGRADTRSALELARRTGARLILFGQLTRLHTDSARLAVTLYDAQASVSLADLEERDHASNIATLVDSISVRVLRELGQTRPIAALTRASIGSRSLPALKAFLQGEQLYRRNDFRRASEYYERAIEADSTFVLALHRLRNVRAASTSEFDSLARWYGARAGALNRGLSPRDSLIILADSLASTFISNSVVATDEWLSRLRRRFATLDEATLRYPDDAELWRELGEARLHFGERVGITQHDALVAFRRAIDLDPQFGPPYFHAVELSAATWGAESAAALARAYRQFNAADRRFALVETILTTRSREPLALPTGGWNALEPRAEAAYMLRRWADSSEVSIVLLRQLVDAGYGDNMVFGDKVRTWLAALLLYRGHFDEAQRLATEETYARIPWHFAHAAVLRPNADDLWGRTLTEWTGGSALREAILALPWLFARGDSAALRTSSARLERLRRAPPSGDDDAMRLAQYGSATARAYLALALGDTVGSERAFAARPDSLCPWWCAIDRVQHARLLTAMRGTEAGARMLERRPPPGMPVTVAEHLWLLERARVAARAGDATRASVLRGSVARLWLSADSALRALVR